MMMKGKQSRRQTWRGEVVGKLWDEAGEAVMYGRGTERGKKERKVEKEVRSVDSPSGMHCSPSILIHTCLQLTAA